MLEPLGQGTPARILLLFAITLVPYSAVAPFAGVFVDRWSRRKLLVGTNLARGTMLVTLPLWGRALGGDGGLFVAVLVMLGLGRLFLTTKGAVLPAVVHERSLVKANSVSAGGGMISALAGGAAGIGAVAIMGPTGAFAIAGVVYFGSAWCAHRLTSSLAHPHPKGTRLVDDAIEVARDLFEGLRTLWAEARLRLPLAGIFALRTVTMFVAIAAILFIKDEFPEAGERAGRLSWSAIALGVAGAGAFMGAVATPFFNRRLDKQAIIILGFVVSGVGIAALGGIDHIVAILALTFAAGFGNLLTKVAVDACMQEALSDDFRGRGFAVYDIVYNLASVAAAALMVAVQASSLRTVSLATGVLTLACAASLRAGFAASAR